jgi:hypothetical protein
MYEASVPVFVRSMQNLTAILAKAVAHAVAHKIDPVVLLQSRLYPDMFPLLRQVQIVSDNAKGCAARLAGVEPPRYEDNEASFAELQARIQKTIDYLATLTPAQIDGSEDRPIMLKIRDQTLTYTGMNYLLERALPNYFFHVTTAYAILRHNGVPLGKPDFLGRPSAS